MKILNTIVIYKDFLGNIEGAILQAWNETRIKAEIGEDNILYMIPLIVSGRNYQERKNDIRNKAIEYQASWYDFCGFSYGELSIISDYFEYYGRKYGLTKEFEVNGII